MPSSRMNETIRVPDADFTPNADRAFWMPPDALWLGIVDSLRDDLPRRETPDY